MVGCGWVWMGVAEYGWMWLSVVDCGWVWMMSGCTYFDRDGCV